MLRLVRLISLQLILSRPMCIQGIEPYLGDFVKKTLTFYGVWPFTDRVLSDFA